MSPARPRRRRTATLPAEPGTIVLDSGALSAVTGETELALYRGFVERGWAVVVPTAVLAETVRGDAKDARLNRFLAGGVTVADCTETTGRTAGKLRTAALRTAATPSGIDAIVAGTAAATPAAVVITSDPDDLEALTARLAHVRVLPI